MKKSAKNKSGLQTHSFTMLNLHDENARHPYYAIRCQSRRMSWLNQEAKEEVSLPHKLSTRNARYQMQSTSSLALRSRRLLNHCRNYCLPTCTEQQLLYHLHSLCGTTYPDSNTAPHNICLESPTSPVSDNFELLF